MSIFPRPVSPTSAFADLRAMFARDRPHRWTLLGLSVTLTGVLVWALLLDSRVPEQPREIIYFQSWTVDRKDSDIIRRQIIDLNNYEQSVEKKQGEFQRLADRLGIEWREDEARNRGEREAAIAEMHRRLQAKLVAAEAKESQAAAGGATGH